MNFLSIFKHATVWLPSLFSQCCGEVMFRQRPAAPLISMPSLGSRPLFLFSRCLSLGPHQGGGDRGGGWRCRRKRECFILTLPKWLQRCSTPSRCLLWFGNKNSGQEGHTGRTHFFTYQKHKFELLLWHIAKQKSGKKTRFMLWCCKKKD